MAIWTRETDLESLNRGYGTDTILQVLGIRFTHMGEDSLSATMPVEPRTHQPYGLLHGGASVVLAESVGSTAGFLCVKKPDQMVVGVEVNANHIRGKKTGIVTATARAVHLGGRTQCWDIRIEDEQQRTICVSRLTLAVVTAAAPIPSPG